APAIDVASPLSLSHPLLVLILQHVFFHHPVCPIHRLRRDIFFIYFRVDRSNNSHLISCARLSGSVHLTFAPPALASQIDFIPNLVHKFSSAWWARAWAVFADGGVLRSNFGDAVLGEVRDVCGCAHGAL